MLCWFFRLMISDAADRNRPPGPMTRRHLRRCEGCRQFLQDCRLLDVRLRADTAGLKQLSGRLRGKTPASLGRASRRRHTVPVRLAVATAACIAGITMVGALVLPRTTEPHPQPTKAIHAAAPAGVDLDLATVWTNVVERPLAGEIGRLRTDTESGVRFLVACLSVNPLTSDTARPVE